MQSIKLKYIAFMLVFILGCSNVMALAYDPAIEELEPIMGEVTTTYDMYHRIYEPQPWDAEYTGYVTVNIRSGDRIVISAFSPTTKWLIGWFDMAIVTETGWKSQRISIFSDCQYNSNPQVPYTWESLNMPVGTYKIDLRDYSPNVTGEWDSPYCAINYQLYRVVPIKRNISLTTKYAKTGDNTPIPITLTYRKIPTDTIKIYNTKNNEVYYNSTVDVSTTSLNCTIDNSNICAVIINKDGGIEASTTKTLDNVSVLNNIYGIAMQDKTKRAIIVTDGNRYYEDNASNRAIIQKILASGNGVYIVGNMLNESKGLLEQLLK